MKSRPAQRSRNRRPDPRREGPSSPRKGPPARGVKPAAQAPDAAGKTRGAKPHASKSHASKSHASRPHESKPHESKRNGPKRHVSKHHGSKPYGSKPYGAIRETARIEASRIDAAKVEAVRVEEARIEAAKNAAAMSDPALSKVQTVTVTPDENGMRVDRFLEARFAGLSFSHIQRVIRKGQLRVNGKRTEPKTRLEAGQSVRIPPLRLDPEKPRPAATVKDEETRAFIQSITLYDDDDVMVLNKPAGLAVQGGSGTTRHLDGMLGVIRTRDGQRPRLVHRLDKDTSGCLLIAKSRFAAAALAKTFRSRSARKIYWALVPGVPKPKQGRISTYLAKEEREDDSVMRVAQHGEEGASHAVTYYAVVETAAARLAWLSLKPVTGRTHQLRVQLAHIGHPIVGDPKYFDIENWQLPGGMQNKLHLLARRIVVPHPRGGTIDASAPLPPHMEQSWNLLGFDGARYDPIEDAPKG